MLTSSVGQETISSPPVVSFLADGLRRRLRRMSNKVPKHGSNMQKYAAFRQRAVQLVQSTSKLEAEYNEVRRSVEQAPTYTTRLSKPSENSRGRNRYMNVIPFEDTRVKLSGTQDYINASYIREEPSGAAKYIATQGPLDSTLEDFWRLCWEQNINTILMLSPFVENGRCKVNEYLPLKDGEQKTYGQYAVLTESSEESDSVRSCTVRKLKLQHSAETRVIKHVHFTGWPDFGNVDDSGIVLKLIELLSEIKGTSEAPLLTHCSAGVGRTGTFIAIDIIIRNLMTNSDYAIDVKKVVANIRNQRPLMVMTPEQYGMIYSVVYFWLFGSSVSNRLSSTSETAENVTDESRYRNAFQQYNI